MPEREREIARFLAASGWVEAAALPLAGDASARRYMRLVAPDGQSAILMLCPPGTEQELCRFLTIARHLSALGFSAPKVLSADPEKGLALLEDLGDGLFARLARDDPGCERLLYAAAADLLVGLHAHPPPDHLPRYAGRMTGEQAALVLDAYLPSLGRRASAGERADLAGAVSCACDRLAPGATVLMLRDFHAENLLWLEGRAGIARVGLLDFQDAMAGHPAYDLVSLLQDARRDVDRALADEVIARYADATGQDRVAFAAACAALGALRQLRILGVFARLARRDGKTAYLQLLPRVWAHLQADLAHPELAELRTLVQRLVPPPDGAALRRLAVAS